MINAPEKRRGYLAETPDEIDALVPVPSGSPPNEIIADGRNDLASQLLKEFGEDLYPTYLVSSPLTNAYHLWGL